MSETGKLIEQRLDEDIWRGLSHFSALPEWLAIARDTERISQELSAVVPEFRTAYWELRGLDVGHVRYKSEFWTALYRLTVRKPGQDADTVIDLQGRIFPPGSPVTEQARVEGSLGMPGWLVILPALHLELRTREAEVVLAALDFLTDPDQSREFLEKNIRAGTPTLRDLKIERCAPKVVRYKPGSRCTVVYRLGYEAEAAETKNWPGLVVAKTYRGEKGQNAYDSMAAIWNTGLNDQVKVSQPLAYLPEVKVLIQGPVPEEQTLKDLLYATLAASSPAAVEQLNLFMRKTAAGLAALHNLDVRLGRDWGWADEMAEVVQQVARLDKAIPELNPGAAPLLDRLNQLAASIPADPRVPAHGSFRPAQVLIHGGEIGFIDFDSFCQSEPANDLALFLGTVMSIALTPGDGFDETDPGRPGASAAPALSNLSRQERYDFAAALSETFLEAYEKDHPVSRQRVILWEAMDIFMFTLHGLTKIKVGEMDDIIFLLNRYLSENRIAA